MHSFLCARAAGGPSARSAAAVAAVARQAEPLRVSGRRSTPLAADQHSPSSRALAEVAARAARRRTLAAPLHVGGRARAARPAPPECAARTGSSAAESAGSAWASPTSSRCRPWRWPGCRCRAVNRVRLVRRTRSACWACPEPKARPELAPCGSVGRVSRKHHLTAVTFRHGK